MTTLPCRLPLRPPARPAAGSEGSHLLRDRDGHPIHRGPPLAASSTSRERAERRLPGWLVTGMLAWLLSAGSLRAQVSGPMDLWPRSASVELGSSQQFGAYVPITPNTIVWLVNDLPGGNDTLGRISASGMYVPPAVAPTNNLLTITARSTAYPSSFASTSLRVTRKYPWLWSVSPATGGSLVIGAYRVSLNGSNFAPDSRVTANGVDLVTTHVSSTQLTAVGTATAVGTLNFAVRQPGPGAVTGNTVGVPVAAGVVAVAVAPSNATVVTGANRTFTATVTGTTNTAVRSLVSFVKPDKSANKTAPCE
ncbi:MAG: hypothetical protein J0L84_20195 [Verrucomicrobia bacterium]|nr:hypothetical protein [Verrucomicrobiota bacterium]